MTYYKQDIQTCNQKSFSRMTYKLYFPLRFMLHTERSYLLLSTCQVQFQHIQRTGGGGEGKKTTTNQPTSNDLAETTNFGN